MIPRIFIQACSIHWIFHSRYFSARLHHTNLAQRRHVRAVRVGDSHEPEGRTQVSRRVPWTMATLTGVPVGVVDGYLTIPEGLGQGVELDVDALISRHGTPADFPYTLDAATREDRR